MEKGDKFEKWRNDSYPILIMETKIKFSQESQVWSQKTRFTG